VRIDLVGARRSAPLLYFLAACSGAGGAPPRPAGPTLFTRLPSAETGIAFRNDLTETREFNVFTYRNFYNGGGVAIGDLTGDGLPEIVLTSNREGPRLFLNEGAFRFRDVTEQAGLREHRSWTTGVTLADVNGDGRLDIYVCAAGDVPPDARGNQLYLNQGTRSSGAPSFVEAAAAWGVDDRGQSVHAAFFDYDRDGDLDLYVVNNSARPVATFGRENLRNVRDLDGGDRLYRNETGHFTDVSAAAGIYGGATGFGLGLAVTDANRDGWPDLYVSNDFFERDFLYINNRDSTFHERLEEAMPSISYSSMGLDVADVDGDGWPDIYVTDMLPADDARLKLVSSFETWTSYRASVAEGYHHQFTRNTLQRNNRNGTFSEVGELAGVARTDWSWSALIADFDLDGRKDIHVTNGIARDLTSQDYIALLASDRTLRAAREGKRVDFLGLINAMTTTKLPDYAFRNVGELEFADAAAAWGLDTPGFSNGAAYGDLDGDGALDLVVNNLNDEASVYRNNTRTMLPANRYLQVRLEGEGMNRFGIGATVTLRHGDRLFFQELQPARGFQSSVDYVLTFGVGSIDTVESVTVDWPDGCTSTKSHVGTNQRLTIREQDGASVRPPQLPLDRPTARPPLFSDVTSTVGLDFVHHENAFVDFDRERLIPKLLSTQGPFMAVADVNGDGLSDAFIGGAKDQPGALLLQQADGRFRKTNEALFARDQISEDLGAVFFDANGDRRPDLYVVNGGSEFSEFAPALQDRLYLNERRGVFRKAEGSVPAEFASGSRVAAADWDGDGDGDLFVGGRVVPWRYGIEPPSLLLQNDGTGTFRDVADAVAPGLARVGMVTDAVWVDVDGDRRLDLVVVGEWMPIAIFRNTGTKLERMAAPGLEQSTGWWNRIIAGDFTGDGRVDFVVGNLGLNTRFRSAPDRPATMYVKDFDGNGFPEQILTCYEGGTAYPLALRDDLTRALPFLKPRYPKYADYAGQTVQDIFGNALAGAIIKRAETFATSLVRNDGDGSFTLVPLPREVQIAPVYGMLASDFNRDGALDLLLAGNFDGVKPEIGRMSASYGLLLSGKGDGTFTAVSAAESGFFVPGQARDIQRLKTRAGDLYVVTRNNDRPLVFRATAPRAAATVASF
jgi:enediyne biosynthesis protein E4